MFWGNCSTLKVMNHRKYPSVEHITGYTFFLNTSVWDVSDGEVVGEGWTRRNVRRLAGQGKSLGGRFSLAICSKLCITMAKVGLLIHRGS